MITNAWSIRDSSRHLSHCSCCTYSYGHSARAHGPTLTGIIPVSYRCRGSRRLAPRPAVHELEGFPSISQYRETSMIQMHVD